MIAIVFGALSGYIGGIFSAVKDTKVFAKSTIIGALINIILNITLVMNIGAMGAAIATAISYWIVWIIRVHHLKKYISIKLEIKRDFIAYIILVIQTILLFVFKDSIMLYLFEFILFIIEFFLFRNIIFLIIKNIIK